MKNVTQADIARALGLSQPTVGLVVGNSGSKAKEKLKQETIDRILQKAKELGYRPHRHAQAMRGGRTTLVGLIHGGGMMQVSNERAYNVARALKERGYDLIILDIHHADGLDEVVSHMLESRVDGLIIACTSIPFQSLQPAIDRKIPIIGLSSDEMKDIPIVRCDMSDGVHRLMEHLYAEGHRRFVQFTSAKKPNSQSGQWQWQQALQVHGFRKGLEAHGGAHHIGSPEDYADWCEQGELAGFTICLPPAMSKHHAAFQPFKPGADLTKALLKTERPLPDVILCPNDDWAFGALNELLRAGIKVPEEVTVTGFNDSRIVEDFFIPITTVRQPIQQMCEQAVELLIHKIENPEPPQSQAVSKEEPLIHSLPCELVIRPSSLRKTASRGR